MIVETRGIEDLRPEDIPAADVWTGGFPCQDISVAGKGAGLDGARSGLWHEWFRLIRLVRPRVVVVENVPGLLGRGMGRVVGDLASCGYDAEWDTFPTGLAFGHLRTRIWIVAYPRPPGLPLRRNANQNGSDEAHLFAGQRPSGIFKISLPAEKWADKPLLGRGIYGLPRRSHRIKALGNAIVPQIAEWIAGRLKAMDPTLETHADFFAGIGGFSLGFGRAGFRTVWANEIEPYCVKVLEKNFRREVGHGEESCEVGR